MWDIFKKTSKNPLTTSKKGYIMQNVVSRARFVPLGKRPAIHYYNGGN